MNYCFMINSLFKFCLIDYNITLKKCVIKYYIPKIKIIMTEIPKKYIIRHYESKCEGLDPLCHYPYTSIRNPYLDVRNIEACIQKKYEYYVDHYLNEKQLMIQKILYPGVQYRLYKYYELYLILGIYKRPVEYKYKESHNKKGTCPKCGSVVIKRTMKRHQLSKKCKNKSQNKIDTK